MKSEFLQRWHDIEPLIDQLFDVPVAERTDWLQRHCGDATLRALVARAIEQAEGASALEHGLAQWLPALDADPIDALPAVPGYRVLRFVGAGGMASVFEAERALPGGPQQVALKLLRMDVHDAQERQRFLHEQRILARLQHPHIAQLLDAGFTSTGTPFLALEFVAGHTLVDHARLQGLGTRERVLLFIDVCAAVEYAHRNLIVHRDLKPSNVLVSSDGRVKLVDFGIAKLLTGEGEATRTEARRLTRAYAAPEQFTSDAATTAIDVYALGVLLAELLGDAPLARTRHATDVSPTVVIDERLRRRLGTDLHAIVQAATQADPNRRYPSVAALGEDLQRHLDGRPLHARVDTLAYRTLTFARRHVWAVTSGAAVSVLLLGSAAIGLHEARLARAAAREARAQAVAAQAEARRSGALMNFLEGLFDNASHGTETNETTEELLAHGRERADADFAQQPAQRIELIALMGDLERRSGHAELARAPLEEAASLAKAQFGPADARTLHIEYLLAKEGDEQGRVREATARLQAAIAAFAAGPQRDTVEEVLALAWLAGLDERIGASTQAIAVGEQALAMARRDLPTDSDALTEAVMNLGWVLADAGHPIPAEPLLREALARKRARLGERHADIPDTMAILTSALVQRGRYDEAEQWLRRALDIDASAYAHPNAHVAWHLNDLANVYMLEGRYAQADALYARSLAIDHALAPASLHTEAVTLGNLGRLRLRQGRTAEAEGLFRDAIARKQHVLGADYGDNGEGYDQACLAQILLARGRYDEAQAASDAALANAQRRYRDAHPDTAFALAMAAQLAAAQHQYERAAALGQRAVAMYAALGNQASDKAIRAQLMLGESLLALGRNEQARPALEQALAALRSTTPAAAALAAHADADMARLDTALNDTRQSTLYRAQGLAVLARVEPGANAERDAVARMLGATPASPAR